MKELHASLETILAELGYSASFALTRPDEQFGDFATNVAMQLAGKSGKNPRDVAEEIAEKVKHVPFVKDASVAGPGFINITIADSLLEQYARTRDISLYNGETVVVEYSCPNYFKELHAGHLYNTIVGDVVARLIENAGASVKRVTFGGDVGLHAAKCVYGMNAVVNGTFSEAGFESVRSHMNSLEEDARPTFLSESYVKGSTEYENNTAAKEIIDALNVGLYELIENQHSSALWDVFCTGRSWSKDYFVALYTMLDVHAFDRYYPESETAKIGMNAINSPEVHEKNIFETSDGAMVFKGEGYDLHTRVFKTSKGLPTYETKDLGVCILEMDEYNFAKRILITGNDIVEYMKVVWRVLDLIRPGSAQKMVHLTNGTIRFGDGKKMSSRLGNVTRAVDVVNTVRELVGRFESGDESEHIALGAVKYEFLKYRLGGDIAFDPEESVSLQGNSGPYIQYALVRAKSILAKVGNTNAENIAEYEPAERTLLRKLSEYSDVLYKATSECMPHHICAYLYELAQEFNRFYEHNHVVGDERQHIRIGLVSLYKDTLEHGLKLLGINAPQKM